MLEILTTSFGTVPQYTGSPTIGSVNNNNMGRALGAVYYYSGLIGQVGGFTSPDVPSTTTFPVTSLTPDGLASNSVNLFSGNDGGNCGSTLIGNRIWVALGQDGGFKRILQARNVFNGTVTNTATNTSAPVQRNVKVARYIDNDRLFWGLGYTGTEWDRTPYVYRISSNTWTPLPSVPDEYGVIGAFFEAQTLANGKILIGYSSLDYSLVFFDPYTNSYSKSTPVPGTSTTSSPGIITYCATAVVGEYLLLFGQGIEDNNQSILTCIRYNTETGKFSIINFPDRAPRWGARCAIDPVREHLYLVGGLTQAVFTGVPTVPKYKGAIVYPFSQFLI